MRPWQTLSEERDNPLMTSSQVALALRVDRKTAIRWLQEGKLEGQKTPGGHWRVRRAAVQVYLDRPADG